MRRTSPQFLKTIKHRECAQPYKADCLERTTIVSVHNGFLKNYEEIKDNLRFKHKYESLEIELIDSEVFPHSFEELVWENGVKKALENLFLKIKGSSTVALLSLNENDRALSILHKGRTVGLNLWKNNEEEIIFSSRWEPVIEVLGELLDNKGFRTRIFIDYGESASTYYYLKPSFF